MSKPPADPRAARAAALAAAEARLRGEPSPSNEGTSTSAKPVVPAWQPSEKGDSEKRKEYNRLLYRGIVRDNGYKQASDCLEVGFPDDGHGGGSLRSADASQDHAEYTGQTG